MVDGSSDELCVKKAIFSMADRVVRNDQLVQLQREEAVLAAFSSSTVLLPTLFPGSQAVSVSSPFLAMLPVGVDLPAYTASLSKEKRIAQAPVLLHALQVALASAHALGFCHCDLRPENVIRAGSTFTIIDWGLACKEGEPMHHHRGSTLFFAEAILQGMLSSVKGTPYFSCFDLESARYVAYGFLCGQRHLIPPGWALSSLEELIVDRKHELQTAGL